MDALQVTKYMDKEYQFKLFGKVRSALVFSVLSTIMNHLNGVYMPVDIIMVALTVNFICAVLHSVVFADAKTRRRFHCGYVLRSISRQSVLVVSSAVANSVHIRDIGTQHENTMMLVVSTTAFVGFITCIPEWFLQDAQQGSLKHMLIYSFTQSYTQLHIPGLGGNTGIGTMIYGLLFAVITMMDSPVNSAGTASQFWITLQQTASMILSNLFLARVAPESTRQVLPIAILVGMYIVSDRIPMSGSVAAFVLWRTAVEVSSWTARVFPGGYTDQIVLYGLLLCIMPAINKKTSSVIAVAAIQTLVASIMKSLIYLGNIGTVLASVSVLLVADIILDAPQ
jgi:hypothetical protein